MSINWGVLVIVAVTLAVLLILAGITVFYIRHWAARHEVTETEPGEGKYFKRFVDDKEKAMHRATQAIALEKKRSSLRRIKWGMTAAFVSVLAIGTVTSLYVNRDALVAKVTLEDEDLQLIKTTHHQWNKFYPENIPDLQQQLGKMKIRGIVLLSSLDTTGNSHLDAIKENTRLTWQRFGDTHHIATMPCEWNELSDCLQQFRGWLFVLLPDHWNQLTIDRMLKSGESVLLYDAPFQVVDKRNARTFSLYDLKFQPALNKSHNVLALAGDRELTLGFDAGTVIGVESYSNSYTATSLDPQALAIDSAHVAGAEIKTRMYAKAVGQGRLVWMDFSPNLDEHDQANPEYFNGLLASVFRYLNKESYQAIATWPEGKPFAALLEEDTEEGFDKAERVARFFIKNDYPVTWYMLSKEAEKNRALTRLMAEAGEVACHGDNHQPFTLNDSETQHYRIALCRKALYEITGRKVLSFRPPEEKFSDITLDALVNNGVQHYIAEHGIDRFVPVIMKSKQNGQELVSVPRMVLDDYALWHDMEADFLLTKRLTTQQIDYVKAVTGLYMFSFHTQFMSDDDNFAAVKYIAHQVHDKDAYFATAQQISSWWKFRSRLLAGKKVHPEDILAFKPVVLSVNKNGKITSAPYARLRTASK